MATQMEDGSPLFAQDQWSPPPGDVPTIMVVDDKGEVVSFLTSLLKSRGYAVLPFQRPTLALEALERLVPDLVLTDINMPEMDGYELCECIKADPRFQHIPVVFMSAMDDTTVKVRAFRGGGVDYLTKPFEIEEVQARVATHLRLRRMQVELERRNESLLRVVRKQVKDIADAHMAAIFALAKLAECRDGTTARHLERVQAYCRVLARRLQGLPEFSGIITDDYIATIEQASPLHDIGKVGIGDAILLKPGRLTDAEFETMKQHTVIGAETLYEVCLKHPGNAFIEMGTRIARSHHEHWNGTGYPDRLSERGIPLCARIMAIADVYDAIRSQRPYKPAMPHAQAALLIEADGGSHFDPQMVRAFLEVADEFHEISRRMRDGVWESD